MEEREGKIKPALPSNPFFQYRVDFSTVETSYSPQLRTVAVTSLTPGQVSLVQQEVLVCGDGVCDADETNSCPSDCGVCGDEVCDSSLGESSDTCSLDCSLCGDFICASGEDQDNCPLDCGGLFCGDGICDGSESADCSDCELQ